MLRHALLSAALLAITPVQADPTATVTITLDGLPSSDGVVYVGLCDESGWETFECRNERLEPNPDGVEHTWTEVPAGTYGITVLHDENENGKMDFSFTGAPKERWGSSNNPPPRMGRSKWKDVKFDVADEPVTMTIWMQ